MKRFLLILVLLVVASCAKVEREVSSNDLNWPRASAVFCWRGHSITFPEGASAERIARIISAVDFHLTQFETQQGTHVLPLAIGITDKPGFSCGDDPREIYTGCWCRNREIDSRDQWTIRASILVYAADDTMPTFYHELYHASVWGWGHGEGTPEGLAKWKVAEIQGMQVVDQIRQSRLR